MKYSFITTATSDERGTISDILYNVSIEHSAIIETTAPFTIRGNHYHKESTQRIYILDGELYYIYKSDQYSSINIIHAPKGSLIETPPYEIHTLAIPSYNRFIVFADGIRGGQDYESDTYRVPSIATPDILSQIPGWQV